MPTETIKCDRCGQQAILNWEITEGMVKQAVKETGGLMSERSIRSLVATAKHHARSAIGFKRVTLGDSVSRTVNLCRGCFTEYLRIAEQFMEDSNDA